jgi:hypothetical protein
MIFKTSLKHIHDSYCKSHRWAFTHLDEDNYQPVYPRSHHTTYPRWYGLYHDLFDHDVFSPETNLQLEELDAVIRAFWGSSGEIRGFKNDLASIKEGIENDYYDDETVPTVLDLIEHTVYAGELEPEVETVLEVIAIEWSKETATALTSRVAALWVRYKEQFEAAWGYYGENIGKHLGQVVSDNFDLFVKHLDESFFWQDAVNRVIDVTVDFETYRVSFKLPKQY